MYVFNFIIRTFIYITLENALLKVKTNFHEKLK